ncbi:ATP/GTP-binding protein [Streptomyces sp. Ru71]|uniref:ATP/GTP-binding protein n=1 Tax=Streptomyces sp. Ru71 TaxID=2080746 RepID=UPI000CDDD1E2|nr:ATP/GTP-binding protein [Streptomyces sp. Ru71]POX55264.1 ATP/GTP-binding protein [Streptomyces sp. Ru71]
MESDGTQEARGARSGAQPGTHANPVPRPAGPPDVPAAPVVPPRPAHAPGQGAPSSVAEWLDTPRPAAGPGIWRFGYRTPDPAPGRERLAPVTLVGVAVPLVIGLLLWSLWRHGSVPYQWSLLRLVTPDDWWWGGTLASPKGWQGAEAIVVHDGVFFGVLVYAMGRLGSWPGVVRHVVARRPQPARALLALVFALAALSLVFPSAFPGVGWDALPVVGPVFSLVALVTGGYDVFTSPWVTDLLYAVITLLVVWPFARLGGWLPYARERLAARRETQTADVPDKPVPPTQWPALREAGQHQAADLLTADVLAGRMNDVDCARLEHAWTRARARGRLAEFTDAVLRHGSAALTHPSGARDLPARTARHDLRAGQVRIGHWVAGERTPLAYGGAGAALDPAALATSLLVVGPSGSGKTRHVVAPVVESLALQALTGQCAVVAVGAGCGPDASFDVVVRVGDPASVHDLDPYAGTADPDEAAALLAEALAGDLDTVGAQRAATALAQLLGPYRAAYGAFPTLPVLRELLAGEPAPLTDLRAALAEERHAVMRRELDARVRQSGTPGDPGLALADRLALLDRPVFADFFGAGSPASGAGDDAIRPFSLRALAHHPLRVRIDLPEHGHEEAARLLTRLVLAQFTAVAREAGREHFACLVLDDATGAVTAESVRRIQRLRSQNAGVVLALRTVADVPEALHGPLYAAVGCRMALSGVSTWDGSRFAGAWGTEWVETRDVAQHTVFADQPMTRALHALRKLVTGKAVTTEAVTVRQVERERWSASELAHSVPPGHAVLSLTTVTGEHAPPLLLDLRG